MRNQKEFTSIIVICNAFLGVIAAGCLALLNLNNIQYNSNAVYLLFIALIANFCLGLWNWKYRKSPSNANQQSSEVKKNE